MSVGPCWVLTVCCWWWLCCSRCVFVVVCWQLFVDVSEHISILAALSSEPHVSIWVSVNWRPSFPWTQGHETPRLLPSNATQKILNACTSEPPRQEAGGDLQTQKAIQKYCCLHVGKINLMGLWCTETSLLVEREAAGVQMWHQRCSCCQIKASVGGDAECRLFRLINFLKAYKQSWTICRGFKRMKTRFHSNLKLLLDLTSILFCCCSGDATEEQAERQHAHVVSCFFFNLFCT